MPSLVAALSLVVSPVHVTLVFQGHRGALALERHAVAEAAAIWAPYAVVVTNAQPACVGQHHDVRLAVVMSTAPEPGEAAWQMPLGAVDFDAAGTPGRVVTVFVDRLVRMLEGAHLWDLRASSWPTAIREQVVGRAVGRVIAHEIGHVLLRSKGHTERGLMRAVQRADELVDPERTRYSLR